MAHINDTIQAFIAELSALPDQGGHAMVYTLLEPALEAEQELHSVYAQQAIPTDFNTPYLGLMDAFALPPNARRTHPRPLDMVGIGYEFNNGTFVPFPEHYLFPLHPSLRRPEGSPALVESLEEFRRNWNIFTHNAFSMISNWDNFVVAGGSVLACLSPALPILTNVATNDLFQSNAYADSDIDIFLWGLDPDQARINMESLFLMITQALPWRATCVRKLNTISIHTTYPARPIQIVLRLYRSPSEILAGFDIDSACCLYDGNHVYINPRGLAACIHQANNVDLTRRSPSYEVRLSKYADRGFEVFVPSLDRLRLNYDYLYDSGLSKFPKGLGRLVVLEFMRENPYHFSWLYRPRAKVARPPSEVDPSYQPMDFKPVEKTLLESNYESLWVRIPYRPDWDSERVERHIKKIDTRLNSQYILTAGRRRLHRHAAFCGTMTECFEEFCPTCPIPETAEEQELLQTEANSFIRGPVRFIQMNPGAQLLSGSFNPLNVDDWTEDAYTNFVCDRLVVINADNDDLIRLNHPLLALQPNHDDNVNSTSVDNGMEWERDLEGLIIYQHTVEDLDPNMLGVMDESEGDGSSYYSDAFGSDLGDLES